MKTGDQVILVIDGREVDAIIVLASPRADSLMVSFDAILDGCVGMMPLLREQGIYHNIMTGRPIDVRPVEAGHDDATKH